MGHRMTKKELLEEMFKGTQFERNIEAYSKLSVATISHVYKYFVEHSYDEIRTVGCNTLLCMSL